MEIDIADASGLPEHLKAIAVTADGKTRLDLSQLVPASEVDGWKARLQDAKNEAITNRKALDPWKALGETPDAIKAQLAKGADPAIIEQMRIAATTRDAEYKASLHKIVGERAVSDLKAELSKAGVIPEALDMIATFGARQVHVEDDGSLRIVAVDGRPMLGDGINGGATLTNLAKALAASSPFATADAGKGGGGKKPDSQGGGVAGTMTRAAFDALGSPAAQKAFMTGGGRVTE